MTKKQQQQVDTNDAKKRLDNLLKDGKQNQHHQEQQHEQPQQNKQSSTKEKLFDTLNPKTKNTEGSESYRINENLGDFFKNRPVDPNNTNVPKFNINEFYRGFMKMSGYAWGFAITVGLVAFGVYKTFSPKPHVPIDQQQSKNNNKK